MNQNLKLNWMFGTNFTFSVIFHDKSIFFINRINSCSNIGRSISVDIAVFLGFFIGSLEHFKRKFTEASSFLAANSSKTSETACICKSENSLSNM